MVAHAASSAREPPARRRRRAARDRDRETARRRPARFSAVTVPPCASTIARTTARPSPAPGAVEARTNFSNSCGTLGPRGARAAIARPRSRSIAPRGCARIVDRRRAVLERVLDQVDQHLLEQHRIDPTAAGRARRRARPARSRERVLEPRQRRADHLLGRHPLARRARARSRRASAAAGSRARARAGARRRRSTPAARRAAAGVSRSPSSRSDVAAPVITASGVRRSCDTADRSELRSSSVRARSAASAPARRAGRARARAPACRASASSRWQLIAPRTAGASVPALERDHTDRGLAVDQRDREHARARQRVGAVARRPRRCSNAHRATALLLHARAASAPPRRRGPARRDRGPAPPPATSSASSRWRTATAATSPIVGRRGDLAREREQRRGAPLARSSRRAPARRSRTVSVLITRPDAEHHGEREQVARVGDREREPRRDEAEVERRDRERRREQRRPAPEQRRDHDRDQVEHRDVGERRRSRTPASPITVTSGDRRSRQHVRRTRAASSRRRAARCGGAASLDRRDHVDLDRARAADQRVEQAAAQQVAPARVRRLAGDDPRDVVIARVREQRVGDAARRAAARRRRRATRRAAGAPRAARDPRRRAAARRSPRRAAAVHGACRPSAIRFVARISRSEPGLGPTHDEDPLARRPRRRRCRARGGTRARRRRRARRCGAARARAARAGCRAGRSSAPRARLLGDVDLALGEPLEQLLGREVDELDLVGALEHRVGHGLAHLDAGDLLDRRRRGSRRAAR